MGSVYLFLMIELLIIEIQLEKMKKKKIGKIEKNIYEQLIFLCKEFVINLVEGFFIAIIENHV